MSGPGDENSGRAISAASRGLIKKQALKHNTRVAQLVGKRLLNQKWADQFVKAGFKYVFREVPIQGWEHVRPSGFPGEPPKPKEWRLTTAVPEADVVFGNSLDDLRWFDSKKEVTSSLTSAQRLNYPKINANGGVINWDKTKLPVNEVDGKVVDLHGRNILPDRGHIAYSVDLSAVASGQRDLAELLEERRGQIKPGPKPTPYLNLEDSRMVTDRGLVGKKPGGKPEIPGGRIVSDVEHAGGSARVVSGIEHAGSGARVLEEGFKARSLVIGVKAWRATRAVATVLVICFVPLTVLDVVIEVAMRLWDRHREQKERERREKQRAIEAVFKEGVYWLDLAMGKKPPPTLSELIQRNILNNAKVQEQFMQDWDSNKAFNGFQYARVTAIVRIETYRNMRGEDDESRTAYSVESRDVYATNVGWEFELENVGEEEAGYEGLMRKIVMRKRLKYTIVPPLLTPYDVIVTKINNLFVDIVQFTAAFTGGGGEVFAKPFSFNYQYPEWQNQFEAMPDFDRPPLNRAVCEYCLGYLYYSAKLLLRHPLEQQDLEGNFEDPRKGWKRRFWLLNTLLEGSGTTHGKNFLYFAEQVKHLVRRGEKSEEIVAALNELSAGALAIWSDLERIEKNLRKPEYYYFGPQYEPSD